MTAQLPGAWAWVASCGPRAGHPVCSVTRKVDRIPRTPRSCRPARCTSAALVLGVLALTGCEPASSVSTPHATPAASVKVVDGDTIRVNVDGQALKVRLLGVDAPEYGDCGFDAATDRLGELVAGREVRLVADRYSDESDRFGRILAYVEVDLTDVGRVLLSEGLVAAWWPAGAPTPQRGPDYRRVEIDARNRAVGSWGVCESLGRR